ncbi:unnamed protein product [Cuscuta epithymum]|uniref:Uncharacterized protein n=1 Tax=Cuscuta epithymum TaxID=186058 RepID=A0AAV0D7L4_9ASTE|nr:unnamed protein product [Cuscuta epithymum]
MEKRLYISKL